MHRSLKRKLVIGAAAVAVASFAGAAYAATQNSGPTSRKAFLNDVAKRLHVSPQQLSSALNGAYLDQLQAAVKDGQLTQAQANALEQRLQQKGAAPVAPFGPFGFGPRAFGGPRGPGGGFGPGPGGGLRAGPGALSAAANYLGLTNAQLFQQLTSGKSLAQIAGTQHKSVSGLVQALTTAEKARLDKLVAAKVITSAQEQKILNRLSARISSGVNEKGSIIGHKGPFPRFRFPNGAPATPGAAPPADKAVPVPPAGFPAPPDLPAPSA